MKIKPVSEIKLNLGINPNGKVQRFFTDTCARHMERYIPYSGEGNNVEHLRDNIEKGPNYITYESPYAHAQYVGYTKGPVRNYTTPGTGPYWDKKMWSIEAGQVIDEVQEYVNGR